MNRLTILITAVLLAGCNPPEQHGLILPQGELVGTAGNTRVYVFIDQESHNICYITERSDSAGAISCVPLAYSNLHQESSNVSYR